MRAILKGATVFKSRITAAMIGLALALPASAYVTLNGLGPHHEGIWWNPERPGVFYQVSTFPQNGYHRAVITKVTQGAPVVVTITDSWGIFTAVGYENNALDPGTRDVEIGFGAAGCDDLSVFRSRRKPHEAENIDLVRLTPRSRECPL
jgi:hypothetical protein